MSQSEATKELGIREWYQTNTRKAMRGLIGATVILLLAIVGVWIFAPLDKLQHAQTFNGALVIPGFGGLWIASFMFIWLIPMREVSFRGQESMERMEDKIVGTMESKIVPAIDTWARIGERIEKNVLPKMEKAADQLLKSAKLVEDKGGPLMESARRLQLTLEGKMGVIDELREAAASVSFMNNPGKPPANFGRTLKPLRGNGAPAPAPGGGR